MRSLASKFFAQVFSEPCFKKLCLLALVQALPMVEAGAQEPRALSVDHANEPGACRELRDVLLRARLSPEMDTATFLFRIGSQSSRLFLIYHLDSATTQQIEALASRGELRTPVAPRNDLVNAAGAEGAIQLHEIILPELTYQGSIEAEQISLPAQSVFNMFAPDELRRSFPVEESTSTRRRAQTTRESTRLLATIRGGVCRTEMSWTGGAEASDH